MYLTLRIDSNIMRTIILLLFVIFLIVILFVVLLIPARIANKKGYSYIGFLVFAVFFYPIALIVSLLIDDKSSYKSESDKADALIKYKQLLDEGVITQEEFDIKKSEYL